MIHIQKLVTIVLAGAALILMLSITAVINVTATDNVNTCAANVAVRASIIATDTPVDEPLRGCVTEQEIVRGQERAAKGQLTSAYMRCKAMFGPARNQQLTRDEAVFCHVCGVYDVQEHDELNGMYDAIARVSRDADIFTALAGETYTSVPQTLDTSDQVSVLFIQDSTIDHAWWSRILNPVTSRIPFVGGLLSDSEAAVASGIVIRPYSQQLIRELGCTTVAVEVT